MIRQGILLGSNKSSLVCRIARLFEQTVDSHPSPEPATGFWGAAFPGTAGCDDAKEEEVEEGNGEWLLSYCSSFEQTVDSYTSPEPATGLWVAAIRFPGGADETSIFDVPQAIDDSLYNPSTDDGLGSFSNLQGLRRSRRLANMVPVSYMGMC